MVDISPMYAFCFMKIPPKNDKIYFVISLTCPFGTLQSTLGFWNLTHSYVLRNFQKPDEDEMEIQNQEEVFSLPQSFYAKEEP